MKITPSILLLCIFALVMTACEGEKSTEIIVSWYSSWMYPLEDTEVLLSYRKDGNQEGGKLTSTLKVRTINIENRLYERSRKIYEGDRIKVLEINGKLLVKVNNEHVCSITTDGSISDAKDSDGNGLMVYFNTVSLVDLKSE